MTRKVFIYILLLLPISTIFSQTVFFKPSKKYLGVSFGVDHSMILFHPSVNQVIPFIGYTGGISYRYITQKNVGLQIELKYSQRGWEDADYGYARRIDYLELPFLTHIYIGNTHRIIFNLGPKIGYKLSESVLKNGKSDFDYEEYIEKIKYPFDYGITAGLGYNLHTRKTGVFELEARGYYGLSDVFPNSKSDYFGASNHLNVSLNVGWYFQLTGK